MTDRHAGYLVTLAKDIREEDAEAIVTALRQIRGVIAVEPVPADHFAQTIAGNRVDLEWRERISKMLRG